MLSRTLMVAATALAISGLAAYAQSSSNPTMQPNPGGASTTEAPGKGAKVKGAKKTPKASESSSTPSMAPTTGTGGSTKVEGQGKAAKVKGAKKNPKAGESSSTPDDGADEVRFSGCLMLWRAPAAMRGFCFAVVGRSGKAKRARHLSVTRARRFAPLPALQAARNEAHNTTSALRFRSQTLDRIFTALLHHARCLTPPHPESESSAHRPQSVA